MSDGRRGVSSAVCAALVTAVFALAAPSAFAGETSLLAPPDSAAGDRFGAAIAADGSTAVVGAPRHDEDAAGAGTAYVFVAHRGLVALQQELRPQDPQAGAEFGAGVAVDGDTAVVGAPVAAGGGAVYVFERARGIWTQTAKLQGASGTDRLGTSVAIEGDTLIAGAPVRNSSNGAVFVFVRGADGTWTQQAEIGSEYAGGRSGTAVALRGDRFVAGAPNVLNQRGLAQVFVRDGTNWLREIVLFPADASTGDRTGAAVAIDDESIVLGAPGGESLGTGGPGVLHVYGRTGGAWIRSARLVSALSLGSVGLGTAVAVDGGTIAAGRPGRGAAKGETGGVELFVLGPDGWKPGGTLVQPSPGQDDGYGSAVALLSGRVLAGAEDWSLSGGAFAQATDAALRVSASDAADVDGFGISVAASGDTALVGTWLDDVDGVADCGSVRVFVRSSGGWAEQATLVANDRQANDRFGWSVAIDGDTAVVGAYREDELGADAGAAYVFVRTAGTWTQQTKLTASDGVVSDEFGWSVAVSGNTALVGAHLDDDGGTDRGSAYVFVRSGSQWSQQQKLKDTGGTGDDQFGESVALSGDTALVGARFDDDRGADSGSAFVYVRSGTTWTLQQKLTDAFTGANFGTSVAIAGDTALVGAPLQDGEGSAYVFQRTGTSWSEGQPLTVSAVVDGDFYGHSVQIDGDRAVVGAYGAAIGGDDDAGVVYVFERVGGAWLWRYQFAPADGKIDDRHGWSVAIAGDSVVAGAYRDDDAGDLSGSAWFWRMGGPGLRAPMPTLVASDTQTSDDFGTAVALSGDTAIVGNPQHKDGTGSRVGAAYVFVRSAGAWAETQKLTASDAAQGRDFGHSVALSGDTAFVGSPVLFPTESGSVYVFVRQSGTWTEVQKLVAGEDGLPDYFGISVALSGDTAIVGAEVLDAAYVYVRTPEGTWTRQQELTSGVPGGGFGEDVALDGDTAIVGARQEDGGAGAAYVFVRTDGVWNLEERILPDDRAVGDRCGSSVAISGDTALVAASVGDGAAADTGCAYVFVRTGADWTQQAKLFRRDRLERIAVQDVALEGDVALLNASFDDDWGSASGAVLVFARRDGMWLPQQRLLAGDGTAFERVGWSLALEGDTVLAGAIHGAPAFGGNARVFDLADGRLGLSPSPLPAEWTVGIPLAAAAAATNAVEPVRWSLAQGALPDGVALDARTGEVSGTPAATGDFAFTIEASDASGAVVVAPLALTVNPAPQIVPGDLPHGVVGRAYRCQLARTGGTGEFTWALDDAGGSSLSLDAGGILTGDPPMSGEFELSLRGTDAAGATASAVRRLSVVDRLSAASGKAEFGVAAGTVPHARALELLGGSTIDVAAKAPRGFAAPELVLLDPEGEPLDLGASLKSARGAVRLAKFAVPATGRYVLRITPGATDPLAVVAVTVKVAPPRALRTTLDLADGQTSAFAVGTLAGAKVKATIAAAKGETVVPDVVSVKDATGADVAFVVKRSGRKATLTFEAAAGGDVVVTLSTLEGTSGTVSVSAAIRQPKGYDFALMHPAGGE